MSDFLGNLALKSLGLTPLVQPRPLSPFEPVPAGGALTERAPAEHTAESAPVESTPRALPRLAAPAPAMVAGKPAESAATDSPQPAPALRAQPMAPPRPAPAAEEPPSPLPPATASLRRAAAEHMPPNRPEAERASNAPARSEWLPQGLWPARLEAEPAPLPAARSVESRAGPSAPVSAPPPVKDGLGKEPESPPAAAASRRVLTPVIERIKPSPAPARAQPAITASNAPAPTISVTIGRVEVRAAPASAPARRTVEKPGPVLSLEDYLRLRSGGKP